MHIAIIGGASTIGSTTANAITAYDPSIDITLIDINEDAAWGHAKDVTHGNFHHSDAPKFAPNRSGEKPTLGTIRGIHTDATADLDPDIAIVAAGIPQPKDSAGRGDRVKDLDKVRTVCDSISSQLADFGPLPSIVVTNPIDGVTNYLWSKLGWSREYFIGYALSESARAADAIAQVKDVHPNRVYCPTMGEHGENVVLVFSKATIDGEPVELTDSEKAEIREYVLDIPFDIADKRGVQDSSRWVTSAGILRILRAMFEEENDRPLCLSTPLSGEYGFSNGCLSVPFTLTNSGVEEIIEWEISSEEMEELSAAHTEVLDAIEELQQNS
ncbi:malate dehydrogenase [Halobellus salinisoli]|uniref:malate dehydrogenase n=1 Tax=Halobellus salinisoli TaxID=3108500 RepID=UPI00300AEC62